MPFDQPSFNFLINQFSLFLSVIFLYSTLCRTLSFCSLGGYPLPPQDNRSPRSEYQSDIIYKFDIAQKENNRPWIEHF